MGTASVYLVYRLGRVAFGRPAGLLAALFLAVAPLHVAYSHMAVTDVTAVALLAARAACCCSAPPAPARRRGRLGGGAAQRPRRPASRLGRFAGPRGALRAVARGRRRRRRARDVHQVQPRRAGAAGDGGGRVRLPRRGRAPRRGRRPRGARLAAPARPASVRADARGVRGRVALRRARRAALPARLPPPEPHHGPRLAGLRERRQRVLVQPDAQPHRRARRGAGRARGRRARLGAVAPHAAST